MLIVHIDTVVICVRGRSTRRTYRELRAVSYSLVYTINTVIIYKFHGYAPTTLRSLNTVGTLFSESIHDSEDMYLACKS